MSDNFDRFHKFHIEKITMNNSFGMWKLIFIIWILFNIGYILESVNNPINLVYLPFVSIASLYAIFNIVVLVYARKDYYKELPKRELEDYPKVAVFYTTYNDFDYESFKTVLELTYPNKEIFILDDSTDIEKRKEVDEVARRYNVKVIRRENRKGFKAGAINNALKYTDAEYIVIVDADERLPKNFIEETLKYFTDEKIAFVQANHYAYNKNSFFERMLGYGVDVHWKVYQDYRNKYGIVNFLGHGAIIRKKVLEEVGGFPEVVSEDIALTVELYLKGYKGVFAKDVLCGEEVPSTYEAFITRHKKWSMGSIEFLKRYLGKMLKIPKPFYEKLDIIVPTMGIPITILILIMAILSIFVPIPFSIVGLLTLIMIFTYPLLLFLVYLNEVGIWERTKAWFVNSIIFMSLFAITIIYLIKGLFKAYFLTTPKKSSKKLVSNITDYIDYIYIRTIFNIDSNKSVKHTSINLTISPNSKNNI